jgi:hypothetical protein
VDPSVSGERHHRADEHAAVGESLQALGGGGLNVVEHVRQDPAVGDDGIEAATPLSGQIADVCLPPLLDAVERVGLRDVLAVQRPGYSALFADTHGRGRSAPVGTAIAFDVQPEPLIRRAVLLVRDRDGGRSPLARGESVGYRGAARTTTLA